MRTLIGLMVGLLPVAAQVADYGRTAQPGAAYDFRAASKTAPVRTAAGAPQGACAAGEVYFQTDAAAGRNLWLCTAVDTWTQVQAGGGGSSFDPATTFEVYEDFPNNNGTGNQAGTHGWGVPNGGSPVFIASEANHPGIIRRSTTSTAGTLSNLNLGANQSGFFATGPAWEATWIFRLNQLNSNQTVRVGLNCSAASMTVQPTDGIYLECDTAECNGGNWYGAVRAASAQTRASSSVATSSTAWVKVKMEKSASNQVTFTVNGGTPFTITNTLPTAGCNPWQVITNGTAGSAYTLDSDLMYLKATISR